jgi:hypothetical protein
MDKVFWIMAVVCIVMAFRSQSTVDGTVGTIVFGALAFFAVWIAILLPSAMEEETK